MIINHNVAAIFSHRTLKFHDWSAYSGETCHPFRPKLGHLDDITNPLTS